MQSNKLFVTFRIHYGLIFFFLFILIISLLLFLDFIRDFKQLERGRQHERLNRQEEGFHV